MVPYIIDFQEAVEKRGKIASLSNLQKMLTQYKLSSEQGEYPKDLSVLEIKERDFVYLTSKGRKQYIVRTKLDFDSDGKVDDYLYVTSHKFGVEKKLDADRPPTLSSTK